MTGSSSIARAKVRLALATALVVATSPAVAYADAGRGERAFQRCYACHSLEPGETTLQGPNLRGVVGRRAGTLAGFAYSPAMTAAGRDGGLVWTRPVLERFLADPEAFMPGTAMPQRLPEAADRAAVIDFLENAGR